MILQVESMKKIEVLEENLKSDEDMKMGFKPILKIKKDPAPAPSHDETINSKSNTTQSPRSRKNDESEEPSPKRVINFLKKLNFF